MTMPTLKGKVAGIVASLMTLGSLPLLAFIIVFWRLVSASAQGQAVEGDVVGLAIMAALAYGLALLCFLAGAAYFGYQRFRHQKRPGTWHATMLAGVTILLVTPPLYFLP
ncbi:hypothetical protein ABT364_20470 [Massilia sp. SR12]